MPLHVYGETVSGLHVKAYCPTCDRVTAQDWVRIPVPMPGAYAIKALCISAEHSYSFLVVPEGKGTP